MLQLLLKTFIIKTKKGRRKKEYWKIERRKTVRKWTHTTEREFVQLFLKMLLMILNHETYTVRKREEIKIKRYSLSFPSLLTATAKETHTHLLPL